MFNSRRRRFRHRSSAAAEVQMMEPRILLSATVAEHDGVGYFLSETNGQVQRYDIEADSWMDPVDLTSGVGLPSAVHVDADGIYAAFGQTVYRYKLDGSNQTHLLDSPRTVDSIHSDGNLLFVYNGGGREQGAYSLNKQTNTVIDSPDFHPSQNFSSGASISPQNNRILARSTSVSPSDISYLSYNDEGEFLTSRDSPYHGDYLAASQTWTFPDGQKVVDDSGNIYSTDSLTHLANLKPQLDDVTFIGNDVALTLSSNQLTVFTSDLLPAGTYTLEHVGQEVFVNDDHAIVFRFEAGQWMSESVALSELSAPMAGTPVDPVGLAYTPDQIEVANDGTLLILNGVQQSIFRWDIEQQIYVDTIPLIGSPQRMAYSSVDDIIYLGYTDGLIRKIDLSADEPTEVPLITLSRGPAAIAVAGQYLFTPSVEHITIDSDGIVIGVEQRHLQRGSEYTWSAINQKFYFLRAGVSPIDLQSIEVNQDGETYPDLAIGGIGALRDSPLHNSSGFAGPVHVSPNGSLVLLGSGFLHNAVTLERLSTKLSNSTHDAAWLGDTLLTVRTHENGTQLQKWEGAAFLNTESVTWDETVHALVPVSHEHVVAVTIKDSIPQFRKLNADLEPASRPTRTLTLTLDRETVIESAGTDALEVTVTRVGDLSEPLVVDLASLTTSAVAVPSSVTFPATEESVRFFASVLDNDDANEIQTVQITATGRQYDVGTATVLVTDNELVIAESDGSTQVNEDGSTDTVSVSLATAPASSVFVNVIPEIDSQLTVTPAVIEFTADNWAQPQSVTVTGADDDELDGSQTATLSYTVDSERSDALFASTNEASVSVTTLDDERPAPVVTVPDDRRINPHVNLTWTGIPDAVEYDLWLQRAGDDAEPFRITVSGTSYQLEELGVGFYNFWVRGRLASSELSPWGYGRFTVDTIVAIHMQSDGVQDQSPEITWQTIPGATAYQVWANNSTTQQNGLINTEVSETAFQFEDLTFGNHQIWIRALGPNGFRGQWSPVAEHYVGPNNSPAPRATLIDRPEFSWNTIAGIEQFRIWISGPNGFRIDESGITTTTYIPTVDLAAGSYRWWVMPQTAEGGNGRWSSAGIVDVGGGVFGIEFIGEPTDSTPILQWQETEAAASYEVYIRHFEGGYQTKVYSDITQTSFQMPLLDDLEYEVWVRPFDAQGQPARWSQRATLTLTTATENIVVFFDRPEIISLGLPIETNWTAAEGAVSYDIFYFDLNDPSAAPIEIFGVTGTSHTPTNLADGRWGWAIRARTSSGGVGLWNRGLIDNTGRPVFYSAAEATTSVSNPSFVWTEVEGVDRYSLIITNLDTGETFLRDDHLTENRYRVESMHAGRYRLWIKGISDSDPTLGKWSTPITVTSNASG